MRYRWTLTNLSNLDTEVLSKDPIGWDEGVYTIKRSEEYKGAFHEYSVPLKFHCKGGGKSFIDTVYTNEDIDGRIDVLVEFDCDGSGTFETLFNGIINLASYQTDGEFTTVNIEKSDLLTKLFSRDEISVDLETTTSIGGETITAIDKKTLGLTPFEIYYENEWRIDSGYSHSVDWSISNGQALGAWVQHDMGVLKSDLNTVSPSYESVEDTDDNNIDPNNYYTFETLSYIQPILICNEVGVNYPITIDYDLKMVGTFTDEKTAGGTRTNDAVQLKLIYGRLDLADTNSIQDEVAQNIGTYTSDSFSYDFDIDVQGSFTLNAGDRVWLVWDYYNSANVLYQNTATWTYETSYLKMNSRTFYDPTTAKSFMVHEALNQVVDSIADSNGNFYSEYYGRTDSQKQTYDNDGCGSKLIITNGLALRMFEKPVTCTFKDLFTTLDALHNIGMGEVNSKIRIEPLEYWFENTKIITLENVQKFTTKNDNSKYINKIDIGYQKWETEFKSGLDEPCTRREYATKVNTVKGGYSKMSKYVASSYSIELTRRKNRFMLPNEDWRYDNDNFIINVKEGYTGTVIFTGTNGFIVGGLWANVQIGDIITVTGTVSNNGDFEVTGVTLNDNGVLGGFTSIDTVEATTVEIVSANLQSDGNNFIEPFLYADGFSLGTGAQSLSTMYNLALTPARMLLAHLNVITAGLQIINGNITFTKGEGNTSLEAAKDLIPCQEDYNGEILSESANIAWNDTNARNITPIWLPETYSFEYPLTFAEFTTIKANPYGYVEFYKDSDDVKQGYIMDMKYTMKTGLTKFELIRKA